MNRLAHELSPYLLQHAHNPVDWYPWGEEAFARARAEDKPVFLSVGYSSCHWCHVMERESFENDEIAAILNEHFVSIKVDREERPDIDSIYMQAVQMMTGRGGWPMSVFLTPEGGPFYAGTYFPPDDRHGMPGFPRVLRSVSEAYSDRRKDVVSAAEEVTRTVSGSLQVNAPATPNHEALDRCAGKLAGNYDPVYGGFGGAPKFPPSMGLEFLMQVEARQSAASPAHSSELREIIVNTLMKMARGGMYDQVGGGFHRYSVDARWLVPHFEKMLYDNALLARLYTRAWQWTGEPFFARIANEVLGWVTREMTSPDGGFYSSLDADSEGEEGKFYIWTRDEVMGILGGVEGRVFCSLYDITERGNWEGHNIPNVPRDFEVVAADHGISAEQLADVAARGKCKLYGVRSGRVWPARDNKVLAAWNAWMLGAFAEAALAFDRDDYREVVRRNADLLLSRIDSAGRLMRHAKIGGLLEDYAGVAWALELAFEAVHDRRYLDASRGLVEQILERFADAGNGGFFDTPADHEKLITRPRDLFDNATPSGNSLAADVLLRLAVLFGDERYLLAGTRAVEAVFPLAERYPNGVGFLLGVAEWRAGAPREIAITGDPGHERFRELRRVVGAAYVPHRVLVAGEHVDDLPLMANRPGDKVMAYICEAYACQEPTDDPERLRSLLAQGPGRPVG